jgi:hypothetical protein
VLRAKVDTGARSSALHVEDIHPLPHGKVGFQVVLSNTHPVRHVRVEAPITRRARVRSSNGKVEMRYFVKTTLELGSIRREIEVSLTSRGDMRHRMLLGRTALRGEFLVDPGRRFIATAEIRAARRGAKKKKKKALKRKKTVPPPRRPG